MDVAADGRLELMAEEDCGKVRYRTELDAKIALARFSRKRHERRPKNERRPYKCPVCRGWWHLTSQGAS